MNICIIGLNLTSLILSKALVNNGCIVDLFNFHKKTTNFSTRTIGISKSNINFINKNIIKLRTKQIHNIKKISIYADNKKKIINFNNKGENLFSLIEVNKLFNILYKNLRSNRLFKIKISNENDFKKTSFKKNYNLIINCEKNNFISRKYFSERFKKNYNSIAYTALLYHKKINNIEAKQYFTDLGPLAFLPLSKKITSVVLSAYNNKIIDRIYFEKFVSNFNTNLKHEKFSEFQKTKLNFSIARKYYFENILLFGDGLHQIHPLAGQGFNMTIRDIKIFLNIIKKRIENGLDIEQLCLDDFENLTKSKNFIFSEGINFIHYIFKSKKFYGEDQFNKIFKKINQNDKLKSFLIKTADEGLTAW